VADVREEFRLEPRALLRRLPRVIERVGECAQLVRLPLGLLPRGFDLELVALPFGETADRDDVGRPGESQRGHVPEEDDEDRQPRPLPAAADRSARCIVRPPRSARRAA